MKPLSFKAILEAKLKNGTSHKGAAASKVESHRPPFSSARGPILETVLPFLSPDSTAPQTKRSYPGAQSPQKTVVWNTPEEKNALEVFQGLGAKVNECSTVEEIKSAYRALLFKIHPDHFQNEATSLQEKRSWKLRILVQSYRLLSDKSPRPLAA